MNDLLRRDVAVRATFRKFNGRPFRWGTVDCARLVAAHLKHMGRPIAVAKAGSYRSATSARAALKRLGFDNLAAVLDAHGLQRIPPAAALPGDIVQLEGDQGFDALHIRLPNGRTYGFAEGADTVVIFQPIGFKGAWRV